MKNVFMFLLVCTITFAMIRCKPNVANQTTTTESSNPLLQKWTGSYNGFPPFDKVQISQFKPAFEAAMAEKSAEINKIVSNTEAPTFQNTIEGLEKTGNSLKRVSAIYDIWKSNMATPELDAIQETIEPRLASFNDSIVQNPGLFKRIEVVYNAPEKAKLNPEQLRLVDKYYNSFVLAGAKLDEKSKSRVAAINQQLASLFSKFSQHLLADENDKFLELTDVKDLDGLSDGAKNAAAEAATAKNKKGSWAIANTRSSIEPFLRNATNRDAREKAWKMFINRGDNGDANDNNTIITEVLQLRAERANLLGYPTHAHWRLLIKWPKHLKML